jgi:uncharacterized paraquat-inducible protein A
VEFLLFWVGFALVVAFLASSRGRSSVGWFLLSLVISPLLAGLLVLALGRAGPHKPLMDQLFEPAQAQEVRCTECREVVRHDARRCKHCGATLVPQVSPPG